MYVFWGYIQRKEYYFVFYVLQGIYAMIFYSFLYYVYWFNIGIMVERYGYIVFFIGEWLVEKFSIFLIFFFENEDKDEVNIVLSREI